MTKTYYRNEEYRCPRCGGLMIPSGIDGEWECSDCDIRGDEVWDDKKKTGYVEVDIEEYEEFLEKSRKEDEERIAEQIREYESDILSKRK